MPGIFGLITRMPRNEAEMQLRIMAQTLQHESFYVSGVHIDESLFLYLGWTARRGSFADRMPLKNDRGNVTLVFSGEEYPDQHIADCVKANGHAFNPDNASYLIHLAEGKDFLANLNGRFHGCLAGQPDGMVTLFNDRYGMHRLYVHQAQDAFYFAAEAKAILAVRPELRSIDPHGLAEYITCGCALNNRTFFRGIEVLPAGSAWTFRKGELEKRSTYFEPAEWEEQEILDEETYYRQLQEVFARILPRYFGGREKVGMSLTGGLDSRMILSWYKADPGSLPCYSFVGPYRECQDVYIARKVAKACSQPYEVIPVGEEFLSRFHYYAERSVYLTDGCLSVVHSPDLYVNERAASIAPARMTGNYGGEVLRRVRAFKPVDPMPGLFRTDIQPYLQDAKEAYRRLLDCHPLSFAVFRQAPWHHYSLLCLEESQITLRSPYVDNEFVKTVFRAPQSTLVNNDISLRLIQDGSTSLRAIRTDRGYGGSLYRPAALLLENYLEFTFKAEYAYDYGMPQAVAKIDHALSALHLERMFLGRHKFYHFRVWYRDALRNYIQEVLLDPLALSRPYVNRKEVEAMVRGHLAGNRNYTVPIHTLLSLELLHRKLIDSSQ